MKITPLITSLLFALSLTGAAHAKVDAKPAAPIAPATIDAEKCVPNAASSCLTADDSAAKDDDNIDLATLPKANPAQQVDAAASPVPEPQTFAMMALGLALLGFSSRRRPSSDKFEN
ncbi:PEP-CTERM protein-sorting domain-containing protein [Duganella sp. CF517]|uniref:PEP-CTERM sorting domain-containing protein n=1 Tax=Duganella sp. CF517 TaxID=1881038 RepID=UPI0008B60EE2|nr:PEP-CTERM sorting domain-containing protein [Duganella sp. CF517]SEO22405.1 PEP-CTERM protein-sorting domain-containing protein [Duganella sp. CF517]